MVVLKKGYCYARAMYISKNLQQLSLLYFPKEDESFMARFFHQDLPLWWRKGSAVFLALFWTVGLLFGVSFFFFAGKIFSSLMLGVLYGSVSIVGLLCVTVLPFLFSAFAVYLSEPWLLLLVSFWKAFQFSFVSLSILSCFGSAGWLFRWLLMFSDLISLPVLFWYWSRYISGEQGFSCTESLLILSVCILIGSFDYGYVSPFLAELIY